MAKARVRGAGGLDLELEIENVETVERAFRDVRSRLARQLDELAVAAAEKTVLPHARRRAAHLKIAGDPLAPAIIVRRRRSAPILTTRFRGVQAQAAGLLEFGGTVRKQIVPKDKKALAFGGQHPVARVRTARHYRAQRFLQGGVEEGLGAFGDDLRDRIVEVFRAEGFDLD